MRWMLAGCCGLALISISVVLGSTLEITQKPRFYGVFVNSKMIIYCRTTTAYTGQPKWYKVNKYDAEPEDRVELEQSRSITFERKFSNSSAHLIMYNAQLEDSGVYFCKIHETWGPGTEVQVARKVDLSLLQYRSKLKDGFIIIQGLMLAVCIAAILFRKHQLLEKRDSIYEEPETDHIYEGLAIETCGGGLYEELTAYTQPDGAEAPWE
ncbi:uncharacterized protein cd79b [Mugil cephalus]|uniref:uncharacterized protein cd79b n=1 Tax=Mugil cephalus TaxID=48193 RepID=UPI001FB78268|nr:uncharacterized protein cd79b [Mugil cephalus]